MFDSEVYLAKNVLNQSTGDAELDLLLREVKALLKRDYQIVYNKHVEPRTVWKGPVVTERWRLYEPWGSFSSYREIEHANSKETISAYLQGLLNGYRALAMAVTKKHPLTHDPLSTTPS